MNLKSRVERLERDKPNQRYPGIPDEVWENPNGFPPAILTGASLCDWVRNVRPGREDVAGELASLYLHAAGAAGDAIEKATRTRPDRELLRRAGELALRDREKALRRDPNAPWPEMDEAFIANLLKRAGFTPA